MPTANPLEPTPMTRRSPTRVRLAAEPLEPRILLSAGPTGFSSGWAGRTVSDDYGNTMSQAAEISTATRSVTQSGKIERAGDVDVFRFVAAQSGTLVIQQAATSGSRLDSYLYVYSSQGQPLARNDDSSSSLNSRVEIAVVAGNTYYIKAAAYGRSVGSYILSLAPINSATPNTTPTAPTTPATPATPTPTDTTTTTTTSGSFQIDVTMTGFTTAQQQIIQQAVDRWEEIIVGDLPNVTYQGRVIDDLAIAFSSITIDGPGSVLGQATATAYRTDSGLPYRGYVQLDTSDVASMQNSGTLLSVLEHEIAHVLGFGVLWSGMGLLSGTRTSSPGFTGANAVAAYNAIFGTNVTSIPVEADGGSGTALAHWEESVLGNELMTGWFNSGQSNPLSRITIASLADLGYQVNLSAADTYTPSTTASTAARSLSSLTTSRQSWAASYTDSISTRRRAIDQVMTCFGQDIRSQII
jgi:hypothetical protein